MSQIILSLVTVGALLFTSSSAVAQCAVTYYAPAPVYNSVARPVYATPVTTYYAPTSYNASASYYAPAPTVVYRAPTQAYYPAAQAAVAPVPVTYGRPVYTYYSPYGGAEVRVPGQPIMNTLRAIVP